jgi:hypothetical protein
MWRSCKRWQSSGLCSLPRVSAAGECPRKAHKVPHFYAGPRHTTLQVLLCTWEASEVAQEVKVAARSTAVNQLVSRQRSKVGQYLRMSAVTHSVCDRRNIDIACSGMGSDNHTAGCARNDVSTTATRSSARTIARRPTTVPATATAAAEEICQCQAAELHSIMVRWTASSLLLKEPALAQ